MEILTSQHRQTNGASEIMNWMVKNDLQCYCSYHPKNWDELFPPAEFHLPLNTSYESNALEVSPFELDLGRSTRSRLDLFSGSKVPV